MAEAFRVLVYPGMKKLILEIRPIFDGLWVLVLGLRELYQRDVDCRERGEWVHRMNALPYACCCRRWREKDTGKIQLLLSPGPVYCSMMLYAYLRLFQNLFPSQGSWPIVCSSTYWIHQHAILWQRYQDCAWNSFADGSWVMVYEQQLQGFCGF